MKVSVSLCAKELPVKGDYYAIARVGEEEIGTTESVKHTANPLWPNVLCFDDQETTGDDITVQIFNANDNAMVSSASLPLAQLMEQSLSSTAVALDGDADSGHSVIALHACEYALTPGYLQMALQANDMKNKDGGLGWIRKSDPFFQVLSEDSELFYTSELIRDNLSPRWSLANIDLEPLYAAGLTVDSPLTIAFWDQDEGAKKDAMGTVQLSVNQLLDTHHIQISGEDGVPKGHGLLVVKRCRLVGHGGATVSQSTQQLLEDAANELLAHQSIEQCKKVAAHCLERATSLQAMAEKESAEAKQAAVDTETAKEAVVDLTTLAIEVEEAAKTNACTGFLYLKLRAGDLPNLDGLGFGIFTKSDPFFQMYGVDGSVCYRSETVNDDLHPKFELAKLDLCTLCNGNMSSPLRITLHEEDSGSSTQYFGQIIKSVSDLLQTDPSQEFDLSSASGDKRGHLYVETSQLVDYKNLTDEATKVQESLEAAKAAVLEQVKAEQAAVEEAEQARKNADTAKEASDAAQKQLEEMLATA